jgi:hypothetical protein
MSRFFIDTEFFVLSRQAEHTACPTVELISIAIIKDTGETYYAINKHQNFDWGLDNTFLREAVYPYLLHPDANGDVFKLSDSELDNSRNLYRALEYHSAPMIPSIQMAREVKHFLGQDPELWAYCSPTDMFLLYNLLSTPVPGNRNMMKYPDNGFPYYMNDLAQTMRTHHLHPNDLPPQVDQRHNAVNDARWLKDCVEYIDAQGYRSIGA